MVVRAPCAEDELSMMEAPPASQDKPAYVLEQLPELAEQLAKVRVRGSAGVCARGSACVRARRAWHHA